MHGPRYLRYGRFPRIRHALNFLGMLGARAKAEGRSTLQVFNDLKDPRSPYVGQTKPVNTVLPAITGTAKVGQTLTVSNGTWTSTTTPTFTRQWKAAGVNIAGATGATYVPVTGDIGKAITCAVTATNTGGSTTATSAATVAVVA